MNWPIHVKKELMKGNPDSQVGIITLWTKKEDIKKELNESYFAMIGQLYNSYTGISYLVRNCLANKNIRYLVMVGEDISGSGEALKSLFEKGVDEKNNIIGVNNAGIHKEVPRESINDFRKNVELIDCRSIKDYKKLKDEITRLKYKNSYGKPETHPMPEIKIPDRFPSEKNTFVVRSRKISTAWIKALNHVLKFGCLKETEFSDDQVEVINLITVTSEDPESIDFKDYYLFTREDLEDYFPKILTANSFEGVEYTYGQRLRDYRSVDQIKSIIEKIKKNNHTRRAVGVTWDVLKDLNSSKAPCINLIQVLVQDGRLFLTAYIRSNDMFKAWPLNAYGLRKLQKMISTKSKLKMGSLTTISSSAHVYKSDLSKAEKIIKENLPDVNDFKDHRGNFVIRTEDGVIKVTHFGKNNKPLKEYEGKNAKELTKELAKNYTTSNAYHAFYLGRELQKAQESLERGEEYVQE